MQQNTCDSNGIQYIFGYFATGRDDDMPRWCFPRHRFQFANPNTRSPMGQFITSNWFGREAPIGEKREYLVVGIRGKFSYNNITCLVNGALMSRGHNRLTELERNQGIVKKEYFVIPGGVTRTLYENTTIGHTTLNNISNNVTLTLCIRSLENSLLVSLPSFEIIPSNESELEI